MVSAFLRDKNNHLEDIYHHYNIYFFCMYVYIYIYIFIYLFIYLFIFIFIYLYKVLESGCLVVSSFWEQNGISSNFSKQFWKQLSKDH
jgi:hypothetical protein